MKKSREISSSLMSLHTEVYPLHPLKSVFNLMCYFSPDLTYLENIRWKMSRRKQMARSVPTATLLHAVFMFPSAPKSLQKRGWSVNIIFEKKCPTKKPSPLPYLQSTQEPGNQSAGTEGFIFRVSSIRKRPWIRSVPFQWRTQDLIYILARLLS